jgi:major vault protein
MGDLYKAYILKEDEALLLKAEEYFQDQVGDKKLERLAGDKWMVYGPCRYIPPVEVHILENRKTIPLDKNEGIYVRDTKKGSIRSVHGQSYMLEAHEELWEMDVDKTVDELLGQRNRVNWKQLSYRCPFNTAVQIYDYKQKTSRVVFGPDLIRLEPDEQFTVFYLAGGKPKRPGVI